MKSKDLGSARTKGKPDPVVKLTSKHLPQFIECFGNHLADYPCDFTRLPPTRILRSMRHSAAVLCQDKTSLQALQSTLEHLGIRARALPRLQQEALELVMTGRGSTLIVDFDLPGAEEVNPHGRLWLPARAETRAAGRRQPGMARNRTGFSVRRQPHPLPALGFGSK